MVNQDNIYNDEDIDEDIDEDSTILNISKYNLVLSELYHPHAHGFTNESDPTINGHYLVLARLNPYDKDECDELIQLCKENCLLLNSRYSHCIIRNYINIVLNEKYIQPQIAECIYLRGDEYVAIIKTHWLKLVQRTWKRVYAERQRIISLRKNPIYIYYRYLNGAWPHECIQLPSIRHMLSKLSSANTFIIR